MKPFQAKTVVRISRRTILAGGLALLGGCSLNNAAVRSQSPEDADAAGSKTRLVGDVAVPDGMSPMRVESVALVTGLLDTGSDPAPSPQRAVLLGELQKRGVQNPNQLLASPTTALVLVQGFLRPGIQKGDRFDVELRIPERDETSSLRGGWLMETRLRVFAVGELDGRIHDGKPLALAEGPILVDPSADEKDRVALCRGRVLGGGVALDSRPLRLILKPDQQSVFVSAQIGTALDKRFNTFSRGLKRGVATPKTDRYVDLVVHPRYKDNIERYMLVVAAVPLRETAPERASRLAVLERQLFDPLTSASAALRLEAIGKEGIDTLRKGLQATDPEVRFYSAEALAYLDDVEAAKPLAESAQKEPAFRAFALAALSAMDDKGRVAAYEALRNLLDVQSAETRYGAFRALWAMNSSDRLIRGETLKDQFSYHLLKTSGPPMIHVTRSYRPEIVLFGADQRFRTPLALQAGNHIAVNGTSGDTVTVSKFVPGEPDQKRQISTKVDDVIRTIVELGGTYPDVVQVLQQAKTTQSLASRFEVDAVPQVGRTYARGGVEGAQEEEKSEFVAANPAPDLFADPSAKAKKRPKPAASAKEADEPEKKPGAIKSFFNKVTGRAAS
ncbi:MAG: flagellar basal body P-ring protein FlgI [Pirellulales bacterium]|jgi:hypothetical protein